MPPANLGGAAQSMLAAANVAPSAPELAVTIQDRELVVLRAALQEATESRKALQQQLEDEKWAHAMTTRRLANAVDEAKQLRAELTDRRSNPFVSVADNIALKQAIGDLHMRLEQEQLKTRQLNKELIAITTTQMEATLPGKLVRYLQTLRKLFEEQERKMDECENTLSNSSASLNFRMAQIIASERTLIPPLEQIEDDIHRLQSLTKLATSEDERAKHVAKINSASKRQADLVKKLTAVRNQKKTLQQSIAKADSKIKRARKFIIGQDNKSNPDASELSSSKRLYTAENSIAPDASDDEDDDVLAAESHTRKSRKDRNNESGETDSSADKALRRCKMFSREIGQAASAREDFTNVFAVILASRAEFFPRAYQSITNMLSLLAGGEDAEVASASSVWIPSSNNMLTEPANDDIDVDSKLTEVDARQNFMTTKVLLTEYMRMAQDVRDRYVEGLRYVKVYHERCLDRERERFSRLSKELAEKESNEGRLAMQLAQAQFALNEASVQLEQLGLKPGFDATASVLHEAATGLNASNAYILALERNLTAAKNSIAYLGDALDKKQKALEATELSLIDLETTLIDKLGGEALQRAIDLPARQSASDSTKSSDASHRNASAVLAEIPTKPSSTPISIATATVMDALQLLSLPPISPSSITSISSSLTAHKSSSSPSAAAAAASTTPNATTAATVDNQQNAALSLQGLMSWFF